MTRSVYVLGGAGSGKSTFTAAVLGRIPHRPGPLIDLHSAPNAKGTQVTLRGHEVYHQESPDRPGLYLGCMREWFPGTDGLDRASSLPGTQWLELAGAADYGFVVAEGATLATRPFLGALADHTELLVAHLHVDPFVADLRYLARGSTQLPQFIKTTVTRSANRYAEAQAAGVATLNVDTDDALAWDHALSAVTRHLVGDG